LVVMAEIEVVRSLAEKAFRDHYDQVFRFVRRQTASDEDAEDIAQMVFADAAARLDDFKPGSSPVLAWLYTVAQRRLIDEARRRKRRPHEVAALHESAAVAEASSYGVGVASAVKVALNNLPDRQRQVVLGRLIEGLSFAEIARRSGASEGACKMLFRRGIANVRDQLRKEGVRE
jgi:RNA polymerase sigma factor (sigma-70 family)